MSSFTPFIPGSAFVTNGVISTFNSNTLGNLFTTGGNVGIGNTAPAFTLDVNGTINASSFTGTNLSVNNISTGVLIASSGITTSNINFTGSLYQNGVLYSPGGGTSQWTTTNGNIFYTGGNVGIYVTAPSTALHVSGGTIITGALSAGSLSVTNFSTTNVTTSSLRTSQMVVNSRNLKSETTAVTNDLATRAVATWTTRSVVDNQWLGIAWAPELGIFCAVADSGSGNRVMTSLDGITWTTRVSAADNSWNFVTWSPELGIFCAVGRSGTGNRVMTSPDGITWTTRASAADNLWYGVTWAPELGLFCAVAGSGTGNRVMTSPDGITWTTRASAANNTWQTVTWSPELGLFCAVSETGTGNRVMTSPDGITWTTRSSAADNQWFGVTWSSELNLFCAVAYSGTGDRVMTSPDGITWTTRSTSDNQWLSVTWAPELGLFCAVGQTGTGNRVMSSPDGITWTTRASAANNQWYRVAWAPELGIFCAVTWTGTGNRTMTSRDVGLYRPREIHPRYTLIHPIVNSTAITATNILATNMTTSSIVLTSGSLNATFNANTMGNIFTTGGSVGIGNTAPSATLDISSSNTFGNIYLGNTIQNRKLVLWSNANNPVDYIGLGVETDTFRYNIGNGGSHVFNIGNTNGSTSKQVFSVGRASAVYGTSTQISVPQTSYLALGYDSVGKETNAGVIGYSIFGTNAVEIVGCGTAAGSRTINLYDNVVVAGSVSKASGTFDIKHPIEEKANTGYRLVHSFIEGSRCDLIYRGRVQLVNGTATVNINEGCVAESDCAMSSGTFEALVANPQIILQNNVTFERLKGTIDGANLTITSRNSTDNIMVEWMVIGERKDPYIKGWDKTNANGYLKTEYISSHSSSITI